MSQAISPSVLRPYGLARVCRVWRIPRSSAYHRTKQAQGGSQPARKRGPRGACSESELTEHVRSRLGKHAFPREIDFVAYLPKTPSGKIQRLILRNQ
jgi:putative transposase